MPFKDDDGFTLTCSVSHIHTYITYDNINNKIHFPCPMSMFVLHTVSSLHGSQSSQKHYKNVPISHE